MKKLIELVTNAVTILELILEQNRAQNAKLLQLDEDIRTLKELLDVE
jgi:hypothetical protein